MPFFSGITDIVGDALSSAASANAQAAAQTAGPTFAGGAGILRIAPEQVDAAIAVFQDALDRLEARVQQANNEIRAEAMAADRVSQPAAAAFNDASMIGPNAAIAAWSGAVRELRSVVTQLEASRNANVMTDETAAQPLASGLGTVN